MIVDIIDVELKNLKYNRKYGINRYKKGRAMYNKGLAKVKKVDKIDEKNYYIETLMKENNEIYNITTKIYENIIKESTCTCEDYKNGNICRHIIATHMEIEEPHYASTPRGKKELEKKAKEEAKRKLEEIRKEKEEKRKKIEYERKYCNGLNIIELYKQSSIEEKINNKLDIEELYKQTNKIKNKNVGTLATNIKLEYYAELENSRTLKISFKIGQKRMYILNNICDFYDAYKNGSELYYGKQLRFIPARENFTEDSQIIFDYIVKYAEMVEYNNKYSDYRMSSPFSRYVYITEHNIDNFLNINKNKEILFHSEYYGDEKYKFTGKKIDISCIFKKEKIKNPINDYNLYYENNNTEEIEEYILKLNITNYLFFTSYKKIYILYEKEIYTTDYEKNIIELLELFDKQDMILIPEDRLEEFKEYVLPRIKYIKLEELPKEITKDGLIISKLASKILLDIDEQGNIMLELKFCYMDYEFNILENDYKTYVKQNNIIRDIPAEIKIIQRIFMDGFKLVTGKKEFIMQNTDDIYNFLLNKIESYMNDFEVLATDKLKNKKIKQPRISNIGIRIYNGLLELDISKINIDINEIKSVLKDYNIKKRYYKLKNGDFLDLANNEDLNLLDEIATTLDIDFDKVKKGIINLPISKYFYLEKIISLNKNITITKNEELTQLIDNIENTEISEDIEIDKELETKLREYQKVGYRWLKAHEKYKFGGILADDMGLGKTLQIIALLQSETKSKKQTTSIVVCPSTLVLNWKLEVEKWSNSIKVLIIQGTSKERREKINQYEKYDLIITSYDLLKRDIDNYNEKIFKYIIADEAQYIKNALTQNAQALKNLKGEIKFALTGTPIENSISELWSILDFIMPGYLYNYNKFRNKFEEPILKYKDKEALERLKRLISPLILRRVKKDVLTELPEKNITVMKNKMEKEQEKIYLSYLAQTKKEIREELKNSNFQKNKLKIFMLITRLRQICCHPSLFIENYKGKSGKLEQCINLVIDAIESGHKILIFSTYTSMFEIIEKEFKKLQIKYFKLIGNTPISKRIEMVDEFNNNDEIKVFLISLKAGGTGLNLTSADVVIHYDPWWNLSSENQATDRAYRIGQKNSVQVYKLITSNSIEEKINEMQKNKEKLSKDILSTEETFINQMSKKEILELFE